MTDSTSKWLAERDAVPRLLAENRSRREAAEAERDAARAELRDLVVRGYRVALDVAEMSRMAGVSRETIHVAVRDAGIVPWRKRPTDENGRFTTDDKGKPYA